MKKLILILIFALFPMMVNAETNCGTYRKENERSITLEVYIDDGGTVRVRDARAVIAGAAGECPARFYKWYCTFPDGSYSYNVEKSDGTWPCSDLGAYSNGTGTGDIPDVPVEPSNKYEDIISCRDSGYKYIKECGCMPSALADLISNLFMVIKIAAPALLLIVGGFDLIKAMSAQDEKGIKKEQQKLVKKFIAAAAIFLIFTIVQFLVTTLANNSGNIIKCVDYLLNGYNV